MASEGSDVTSSKALDECKHVTPFFALKAKEIASRLKWSALCTCNESNGAQVNEMEIEVRLGLHPWRGRG